MARGGVLGAAFFVAGALALAAAPHAQAAEPDWAPDARAPRAFVPAASEIGDYERCGEPDAGLAAAAHDLLERRLDGQAAPTQEELAVALARRGVPYPWVRAFSQAAPDAQALDAAFARWSGRMRAVKRCGIARGSDANGGAVLTALSVDALADLAPLPARARLGQWLGLEAELRVPADGVSVVLLGPGGAPRRVLSSLSEGRVVSRFALDAPGAWLVQLVADLADGPTPVLAAHVFVEVEPNANLLAAEAGGEHAAGAESGDDREALVALLNGARADNGLAPLVRDRALDRVAAAHAQRMRARARVAHDLGDGGPAERVEAAGIARSFVGENVASAPSIARAHRALWSSPSHRENLLYSSYRRVGLGIATGDDGRKWVCQLFSE